MVNNWLSAVRGYPAQNVVVDLQINTHDGLGWSSLQSRCLGVGRFCGLLHFRLAHTSQVFWTILQAPIANVTLLHFE